MSPPTQGELHAWANERLSEGQSLGRALLATIRALSLDHMVILSHPTAPTDLRWGQGFAQAWTALTHRLTTDWPEGILFVELPLRSVNDPEPPGEPINTVTCGDEVYAVADISQGRRQVEVALRAHDPSTLYVAAILLPTGRDVDSRTCPTVALKDTHLSLGAVVVGAYDGEGFVYTTPSQA